MAGQTLATRRRRPKCARGQSAWCSARSRSFSAITATDACSSDRASQSATTSRIRQSEWVDSSVDPRTSRRSWTSNSKCFIYNAGSCKRDGFFELRQPDCWTGQYSWCSSRASEQSTSAAEIELGSVAQLKCFCVNSCWFWWACWEYDQLCDTCGAATSTRAQAQAQVQAQAQAQAHRQQHQQINAQAVQQAVNGQMPPQGPQPGQVPPAAPGDRHQL